MRKIILSDVQIKEICERIGNQLTEKFKDCKVPPVFVGVMKGAIPFMTELINHVNVPLTTDYIRVKSWNGLGSTGEVNLCKDLDQDVTGKDVVVVEDVIDSGLSIDFLIKFLKEKHHPKSITIVTLLDKKVARKVNVPIDYYGIEVGNEFLMGFGLDYYDLYRNTNYVFVPDMEEVASWDEILKNK